MPRLKQDNLGAKGESRFSEWCEDEGLICNKSLRDRAGWDYIVDFEHDEASADLLDHRRHPLSCVVQVKTIQDSTDRASVKLNMAERLAKEPKPSFLVVLKVDEHKNFSSAHVIHIIGECLATILKRLRREESLCNRESINKKHITFKVTEDSRIDLSGESLKEAFVKSVGTDLQKYISEKSRQLSSLGYEMNAFEGKFVMTAPDVNTLIDFLLGEKGDAQVDSFEVFETRFGIRLPHLRPVSGKVTLTPHPSDRCKIKLRNPKHDYPVVLDGEVYHLPLLIEGRRRTLFKCDLLRIAVDQSAEGSSVQLSQDAISEATIESWEIFHMVRWMIWSSATTVDISVERFGKVLSLTLSDAIERVKIDESQLIRNAHLFELLGNLQRLAGSDNKETFDSEDVRDAHDGTVMLSTLMSKKGLIYTVRPVSDRFRSITEDGILIINKISIGNTVFGYFGEADFKMDIHDGEAVICLSSLVLKGAEVIGGNREDFDEFKRSICAEDKDRLYFSAEA